MIEKHDKLYQDYVRVTQIPIVPTMLDVVCRLTGMGFAAVARVTEDRWLACSVLDHLKFGLEAGGELKIESTLCNEIRDSKEAIVIDHVDEDKQYHQHHTPKTYGLQSYISFPIILKDGRFFGTLCAIDPKPALLHTPEILGTFKLFAELLAFHLESMELMERSHSALSESMKQLSYSNHENMLYQQISDHNMQEQVRKITLFSDMLLNNTALEDMDKVRKISAKIHTFSHELSSMMKQVTKFSSSGLEPVTFEPVDLNTLIPLVQAQLANEPGKKNITVTCKPLPVITAIPEQISQLFFELMNYALAFSKDEVPVINIYARELPADEIKFLLRTEKPAKFCEVFFEHSGIDVDRSELETIFDIFIHLSEKTSASYGAGLAYCRKIIHNHGGVITAHPAGNAGGIVFRMVLPFDGQRKASPQDVVNPALAGS